jgi:Asp-tRNA(Asn)/Glu-tRNA(Gln) amidotransferase A subunit family amidase
LLDKGGLEGARIGVIRESIGLGSDPESEDFDKVKAVFDRAVIELGAAGATLVDPVVIPGLEELTGKRAGELSAGRSSKFSNYFGRSAQAPFSSEEEMRASPEYSQVFNVRIRAEAAQKGVALPRGAIGDPDGHYEYLKAREELMISVLKVMADHQLDALVHNSIEHQPTLIEEGINPPYTGLKGAPHLNTTLSFVPSVVVPSGFTSDDLPAGICFLGRPFTDGLMVKLAYAYEQSTMHRKPPSTTPPLAGEP